MGTWPGHKAKFVRRFAEMQEPRDAAVESFGQAVRDRTFPREDTESYSMDKLEWGRFLEMESTTEM